MAAFEKELELDHDAPGFRIEAAVVGVLVERYALNKNPDSFITAFSNYLWECQENRSKTCPRG
ncbi:MAG TPA: hypothetical protein VHC20_07760 [Candidatus Paceibacterota bacterium]|nr:hypothetical protein [Candidatus Paceibacterota bacterium]